MTPEDFLHVRLIELSKWHADEMASAAEWEKSLASWRSHGLDPGGAEERCVRARFEALERAGQLLAAIRVKLRRVELIPHWSPPSPPPACLRYGSLLGPDYYRLVPEPLLHGVPDSERIYGSDYLARHPEIQLEHGMGFGLLTESLLEDDLAGRIETTGRCDWEETLS